jgi:uncharacterized protein
MKFSEHRDSNINTVKSYQTGMVKINGDTYQKSLHLTQHSITPDWDCSDITQLDKALIDDLIKNDIELIILGTGEEQVFPDFELFAYCRSQNVGLDVMANDAACRTYNILTTEDRNVCLALII